MNIAHFHPSSRLAAEIAATQGVYNKQNVKNEIAINGEKAMTISCAPANKTPIVATTLSFIKSPLMSDVTNLQSPRPIGAKIGEINPATPAKILSLASVI